MNQVLAIRESGTSVRVQRTSEPSPAVGSSLVIIDPRALDRQCLAQGFTFHGIGMNVLHFGSVADWRFKRDELAPAAAILLNIGGRKVSDPVLQEEIKKVSSEFAPAPVVLLSDVDDLNQVLAALDCEAKGYIPTSVSIEVCIKVISLVIAGGIFVPASSVIAVRSTLEKEVQAAPSPMDGLTSRQASVAEALRRGKANKVIAYDLNMCESTVKVHIRNIMKKMNARNRTEVAFKLNNLLAQS